MTNYAKWKKIAAELDSDSDPEFLTKNDRKLDEINRVLRAEKYKLECLEKREKEVTTNKIDPETLEKNLKDAKTLVEDLEKQKSDLEKTNPITESIFTKTKINRSKSKNYADPGLEFATERKGMETSAIQDQTVWMAAIAVCIGGIIIYLLFLR